MDNKTLLDAITKELDLVQTLFFWAIPVCFLMVWARWRNREVVIGPLSFELPTAYIPGVLVFGCLTGAIALAFFRIGSLLGDLDSASWSEGVTRVWSHPWLFNPLSFYGDTLANRLTSSIGYGTLVLAWWFCVLAVSGLLDYSKQPRSYFALLVLPFTGGLCCMAAIQRVYSIIVTHHAAVSNSSWAVVSFGKSINDRKLIALLCILIGATGTTFVHKHHLRKADFTFGLFAVGVSGFGLDLALGLLVATVSVFIPFASAVGTMWIFLKGNMYAFVLLGLVTFVLLFLTGRMWTGSIRSDGLEREKSREWFWNIINRLF